MSTWQSVNARAVHRATLSVALRNLCDVRSVHVLQALAGDPTGVAGIHLRRAGVTALTWTDAAALEEFPFDERTHCRLAMRSLRRALGAGRRHYSTGDLLQELIADGDPETCAELALSGVDLASLNTQVEQAASIHREPPHVESSNGPLSDARAVARRLVISATSGAEQAHWLGELTDVTRNLPRDWLTASGPPPDPDVVIGTGVRKYSDFLARFSDHIDRQT